MVSIDIKKDIYSSSNYRTYLASFGGWFQYLSMGTWKIKWKGPQSHETLQQFHWRSWTHWPFLSNGLYTWSNNISPPTLTLIDRFLATEGLLENFSNVGVQRLNRPTFDHYPILLSMGCCKWVSSPFRFENMWLNHFENLPMVEYGWKNTPLRGALGHSFINQLKTKRSLKEMEQGGFRLYFHKKKPTTN